MRLTASAQPATGLLKWEVSADGGMTWTSAVLVYPGEGFEIRAVASWSDGATSSVGFAGATLEQIDLAGAHASDVFGGASGSGGIPTYVTRRQGAPENWRLFAGTALRRSG